MLTLRPPCKEMKCILYPACLTKTAIDCSILREHYEACMKEYKGLANQTSKTWGGINIILPEVKTIRGRIVHDTYGPIQSVTLSMETTYLKPFGRKLVNGKVLIHED